MGMATVIYWMQGCTQPPTTPEKSDYKGKKSKGKNTANMEGTTRTKSTATIKRRMRGEEEVEENKTEPHDTPNKSTGKSPPYAHNEGEEDEMGGKITPIHLETQAEEAATRGDKTCRKNE